MAELLIDRRAVGFHSAQRVFDPESEAGIPGEQMLTQSLPAATNPDSDVRPGIDLIDESLKE